MMSLPRALSASLLFAAMLLSACPAEEPVVNGNKNNNKNNNSNCTSRCVEGEVTCLNSRAFVTCVLQATGCYDFSGETKCSAEELCKSGECKPNTGEMSNECEPGTARCNVLGQAEVCGDFNDDNFFEFGNAITCEEGRVCDPAQGACVLSACKDTCDAEGATACEGDLIWTCVRGGNGCLKPGPSKDCAAGKVCVGGECVPRTMCEDECVLGERVCGPDGTPRVCEDGDSDGCVEFVIKPACSEGRRCESGACVGRDTCRDTCTAGSTVCVGNALSTCRDTDADGCVEFAPPAACPNAGQTCRSDGATARCAEPPMTGKVVINEIFYDPLGDDVTDKGTPNEYSSTFIELLGPPGLSVAGYTVKLVNGANGMPYGTFKLPADAVLDGNGYAIVVMNIPDYFFAFVGTNFYDVMTPYAPGQDALQNGPDAVELLNASDVRVDAVGYGAYGGNHVFTGEGMPAPGVFRGHSLGRRRGALDTNNNAADFAPLFPTPGLPNSDLFIHEVYFDQPGPDGQPGMMETFVEIVAPIQGWVDFELNGYTLRAINGADGMDYLTTGALPGVDLSSVKLNDIAGRKGFVVVCNQESTAALKALCSKQYVGPDLQNGPDNVVLEYNGRVVDAIGYGTFSGNTTFKGEGRAAPFTSSHSGRSLSRWPLSDPSRSPDTDDNSVDFARVAPTPAQDNARPAP
jgi:hypothetical protein